MGTQRYCNASSAFFKIWSIVMLFQNYRGVIDPHLMIFIHGEAFLHCIIYHKDTQPLIMCNVASYN